eukprot:403364505
MNTDSFLLAPPISHQNINIIPARIPSKIIIVGSSNDFTCCYQDNLDQNVLNQEQHKILITIKSTKQQLIPEVTTPTTHCWSPDCSSRQLQSPTNHLSNNSDFNQQLSLHNSVSIKSQTKSSKKKQACKEKSLKNTKISNSKQKKQKKQQVQNYQEVQLQIWDTTGQEKFRSLTPMYFRDSVTAILIIDLSEETLDCESLRDWVNMVQTYGPSDLHLWVVGNKLDLIQDTQTKDQSARVSKIKLVNNMQSNSDYLKNENSIVKKFQIVNNKDEDFSMTTSQKFDDLVFKDHDILAQLRREQIQIEMQKLKQKFRYIEVSARNGTSINELFNQVSHQIVENNMYPKDERVSFKLQNSLSTINNRNTVRTTKKDSCSC